MSVSQALWNWNVPASGSPTVNQFSSGFETKTGLQPSDLAAYVTVPLQDYSQNPPAPVEPDTIIQWIRWAEDWVENQTGLLLCQSWVASPPAVTQLQTQALGITPSSSGG